MLAKHIGKIIGEALTSNFFEIMFISLTLCVLLANMIDAPEKFSIHSISDVKNLQLKEGNRLR